MSDVNIKKANSPYIFSFPHSGMLLSAEMEWKLFPEALEFLPNIDWHLNELYGFLQNYKVNIISTPHSRYVVDVNRPPDAKKLGNYRDSLVYNTTTWDEEMYNIAPTQEEVERRIRRYYTPYHEELEALIEEKVREFGKVYLIDIHSFMGPISADVCLGNRNNSTSSSEFLDKLYNAFNVEGFKTVKNDVFIGGYITKHYALEDIVETLQIELRYTTYIEEHELDIRQKPSQASTLFYETAYKLEEVFNVLDIKKEEKDALFSMTGKSSTLYLWVMVGLAIFMVLASVFQEL